MDNKLLWGVIIALIVGGIVGYLMGAGSGSSGPDTESAQKEIALYKDMRKLWADHVFWTREYIISALGGSASADADAKRLLKNQEDIGAAVATYYGDTAGDQLTTLLKEHITIAVEIVTAAKANDQTKLQDANKRWKDNATTIASFLAAANPNWSKGDLETMMQTHLSTTEQELDAIFKKDHPRSVTAFDNVFDHMMTMSDMLSEGIITQFPDKF